MRIQNFFSATLLSMMVGAPALCADAGDLIREGESQLKKGQIDAATQTLLQAVVVDPTSSLAYTRLGGAQTLKQEYGAAIMSFQQALTLDGENANAFVGMAIAYLHTGRYSLARAALEEAKRLDTSKQQEVDKLIAWIDERTGTSP